MLRQNNLDDQRFEEIFESARMSVNRYLPVWNDLNTHDPGVMLMELMAWLTEIQRFQMDQSEQAAAFFPLLGVGTRRAAPARVMIFPGVNGISEGELPIIPAGTPVMAEEVRFELSSPFGCGVDGVEAVQRETLCEDVDCGEDSMRIFPGTYLCAANEPMLFYELDGMYVRIRSFSKIISPESGLTGFAAIGEFPAGARFRAVCCDAKALRLRLLGVADGFPERKFVVDTRGQTLLHDSFSLLVGADYELSTARRWELVDNFSASSPQDCHYTLNDETGEIIFGDGLRGAMPRGVVMIASAALTCASGGNIASGRLDRLHYGGVTYPISQPTPAEGGAGRESAGDTLARWRAEMRRAVTAGDIEALVVETPGVFIEQARAFSMEEKVVPGEPRRIAIAAKPQGGRARLSDEVRRAVRAYLEPYRLAGFEFEVRSPQYIRVDINAELRMLPHGERFEDLLKSRLAARFLEEFGGFGANIRRSAIKDFLFGFPQVLHVSACELRAIGSGAFCDGHGDIWLDSGALAVPSRINLRITY